ncbi:MAG TPA: trehalase family glycosidase [Bacteroidota bacterium]|nr:trehalase family glycosidase [Bacteroidota bacterium]
MFKDGKGVLNASRAERLVRKPVDRLSRLIRERYWDELTRTIDERGMDAFTRGGKESGRLIIFVPHTDPLSLDYFTHLAAQRPEWKLEVCLLPENVRENPGALLSEPSGLLGLGLRRSATGKVAGVPFVAPCEHHNELRAWDSYFIVSGLLKDGRVELARAIVDNCVYEVEHYGAVLSSNHASELGQFHPSLLSSMAAACYGRLPRDASTRKWLSDALCAAIAEYRNVWLNPRTICECGLSCYPGNRGTVDRRSHLRDAAPRLRALRAGAVGRRGNGGTRLTIRRDHARSQARESKGLTPPAGISRQAIRDSSDLAPLDLNTMLYKLESDIASVLAGEFRGKLSRPDGTIEYASTWRAFAAKRKILIRRYLWNAHQGVFLDYDWRRGVQGSFIGATSFYPLWAGLATRKQAEQIVHSVLPLLEGPGGLMSSPIKGTRVSEGNSSAWTIPYGWAPHQILLWQGLIDYGYADIARRLAYKWVYGVTLHALKYDGELPDKIDVGSVGGSRLSESENPDVEFSSSARGGYGWTNASYQIGVNLLTRQMLEDVNRLVPGNLIF